MRELSALLVVVVAVGWSVHAARGAPSSWRLEQECPPEASQPRLVRPIPSEATGVRSYATGDIDAPHPEVTRAIIHVHGASRNADDYFCWMFQSLEIEYGVGGNPGVFIIAPNFLEIVDDPKPLELYWTAAWRTGDNSIEPIQMSSFEVVDRLVETYFLDTALYPNLEQIILSGHSAGGQFFGRHAQGSRLTSPRVPIRWIPSNPSTYAYLDGRRPFPLTTDTFAIPTDAPANYNDYIYGLDNLNPYMSLTGRERIIQQYFGRDVVYLQGMNDTCSDVRPEQCHPACFDPNCASLGLDSSPGANMGGTVRYLRSIAYYNFLELFYGQKIHKFISVANTGHDGNNMFKSADARAELFH